MSTRRQFLVALVAAPFIAEKLNQKAIKSVAVSAAKTTIEAPFWIQTNCVQRHTSPAYSAFVENLVKNNPYFNPVE